MKPSQLGRRFQALLESTCTYREKHDGDCQRDGGEDGKAHQQQHGVKLVHFGKGVQ